MPERKKQYLKKTRHVIKVTIIALMAILTAIAFMPGLFL